MFGRADRWSMYERELCVMRNKYRQTQSCLSEKCYVTAAKFESGLELVNKLKCAWFIFRSTFLLPMSVSVIAKPYTLCTESLKSITSGVAKQHEPLTQTSALFTATENNLRFLKMPPMKTQEDSHMHVWKWCFLCHLLPVYFVWAWVGRRVTWPVSSPHLCRRSRSQSQRHRC